MYSRSQIEILYQYFIKYIHWNVLFKYILILNMNWLENKLYTTNYKREFMFPLYFGQNSNIFVILKK